MFASIYKCPKDIQPKDIHPKEKFLTSDISNGGLQSEDFHTFL